MHTAKHTDNQTHHNITCEIFPMKIRHCLTSLISIVLLSSVTHHAHAEKDIYLGHLTNHTGEYASFGAFFDGITDFTLDVINQNPPLGRNISVIHQDVGTVGEWRAVKKLLDKNRVEIILNVAHEYESYRERLLKRISFMKKPVLPSVHGGAINAQYGGVATEPLFRGSPMDSAQSAAAMLHIKNSGKKTVVLVASKLDGHLMQMAAAKKTAEALGLTVLNSLIFQPAWTDYSSVVQQVAEHNADAVAIFSQPVNGGILVRNAADRDHSWFIVGTSEWQEKAFMREATLEALESHESVTLSAYSHNEGPAWHFYANAIEASEHSNVIGNITNSYAIQFYDLLIATALAIESAGHVRADSWSKAMHEVTGGEGEVVHTYQEGIEALRAGKKINYEGITGSMQYNKTGVVAGLFGIFEWTDTNTIEQVAVKDGKIVAELDQL